MWRLRADLPGYAVLPEEDPASWKGWNVAVAVAALALLLVPIVGTVYPAPPFPQNYFAYIFIAYLLAGMVLVWARSRSISEIGQIREVLEQVAIGPARSSGPTGFAEELLMDRPAMSGASNLQDRAV